MIKLWQAALVVMLVGFLPLNCNGKNLDSQWYGLAGEELKRAVAADCLPSAWVTNYTGVNGLMQIIRYSDESLSGGSYLNRFSTETLLWPPSPAEGSANAFIITVFPFDWWNYSENVAYDLYNLVPAPIDVKEKKSDFGPGTVTDPTFDNGFWRVGRGLMDDALLRMWQPPVGYEGDVARIMFYLFTVYPDFGNNSYAFFYTDGKYYPGMSVSAARQALAWHRQDPAGELEQKRNDVFCKYQGNVNPFVEYPELAEYLWGSLKGVPYGNTHGEEPPAPQEEEWLKAVYSVNEKYIYLHVEGVPSDSQWSIDGTPVAGKVLSPEKLGVGVHELKFKASETHGRLLIEVIP